MKHASVFGQMKWFTPAFLLLFSFFINACVDKEPLMQEGIIGERILLKNDREYVDYLLAEIEKCKAAGTAYNFEDKDGKVVSNPDRRWLEMYTSPSKKQATFRNARVRKKCGRPSRLPALRVMPAVSCGCSKAAPTLSAEPA